MYSNVLKLTYGISANLARCIYLFTTRICTVVDPSWGSVCSTKFLGNTTPCVAGILLIHGHTCNPWWLVTMAHNLVRSQACAVTNSEYKQREATYFSWPLATSSCKNSTFFHEVRYLPNNALSYFCISFRSFVQKFLTTGFVFLKTLRFVKPLRSYFVVTPNGKAALAKNVYYFFFQVKEQDSFQGGYQHYAETLIYFIICVIFFNIINRMKS